MPVAGDATFHPFYEMPLGGVNLHVSPMALVPTEALLLQNMIHKIGLGRRNGYAKFETDEVSSGNRVVGLHRFYKGDGTAKLIAVSGSLVRYHDGATWQTIDSSRTSDLISQMATWGSLGRVYIANGTDVPISWDGTDLRTIGGANAPTSATQFLPYQDRLLYIQGGDLAWSGSFDDASWESISSVAVRPDPKLHGMILHSATNTDSGLESKVLLAGSDGMYLFSGRDLRPPNVTTGTYQIDQLAVKTGCNAPRTMKWTREGTVYLGTDKQVYLLPFSTLQPIPIGDKIRSNRAAQKGIESIPSAQLTNASAVYHDGFYKLSVTPQSGSAPTIQWWLDVDNLQVDSHKHYGPWFGPMDGMSFLTQITQDGPGDNGQLIAGEALGATGSFVYEGSVPAVYDDIGSAIECVWQSYNHRLSDEALVKDIHQLELDILTENTTINIDYHEINGSIRAGDTLVVSTVSNKYGVSKYNTIKYSGFTAQRHRVPVDPALSVRVLSLILKNSNTKRYEIYGARVEEQQTTENFG